MTLDDHRSNLYFDSKAKRGIFRKIFNVIYSPSMHCKMKKG